MSLEKREFDLVIFGATGYTGVYVVRELVLKIKENLDDENNGQLRWAVAGRNLNKLDETLAKVGAELDYDLSNVAKIQADIVDPESLLSMARRTTLVVNVVGPYRFFGKAVVEACVEAGSHHVDISGEPQYIEQTQLDYHQTAIDRKLLIISACGWDSIPCDMGVDFLKRNFDGQLHSVETFVQIYPGPEGYKINYATLESAMHGVSNGRQLSQVRRQLYSKVFPNRLPRSRIILKRKTMPFRRPEVDGWNVEFLGSDRSIVQRTQYYNFEKHSESPVQIQTYFTLPSFKALLITIFLAMIFSTFSRFKWGRSLLDRYPGFFTCGAFSRGGPTREQLDATTFSLKLIGKGWSKKNEQTTEETTKSSCEDNSGGDKDTTGTSLLEPSGDPDKSMTVLLNGRDPGYIGTAGFLIAASLTLLKERSNMPIGGVLTTASAFRDTKLMERLQKSDITIKVVSE